MWSPPICCCSGDASPGATVRRLAGGKGGTPDEGDVKRLDRDGGPLAGCHTSRLLVAFDARAMRGQCSRYGSALVGSGCESITSARVLAADAS